MAYESSVTSPFGSTVLFMTTPVSLASATEVFGNINTAAITSIDNWCSGPDPDRYRINSVVQPAELYFHAGISNSLAISPFSASKICGTTSPTFTYFGYMTDTLTLPSTISVDPSTGNVLVSSSEPITNMTIVVYAYLPN
jgi:hypothetical protein